MIAAAALINALDLTGRRIEDVSVVVNGAGAAAIACVELFKSMGGVQMLHVPYKGAAPALVAHAMISGGPAAGNHIVISYLKVVAALGPAGVVLCDHHVFGYRQTLEEVAMGLAATLRSADPEARAVEAELLPEPGPGRVRRRIRHPDGRVWVQSPSILQDPQGVYSGEESAPGPGATFFFTVEMGVQDAPAVAPPRAHESALDGLRVLVIDDNATNRRFLCDLLQQRGMTVEDVASGPLGLAAL